MKKSKKGSWLGRRSFGWRSFGWRSLGWRSNDRKEKSYEFWETRGKTRVEVKAQLHEAWLSIHLFAHSATNAEGIFGRDEYTFWRVCDTFALCPMPWLGPLVYDQVIKIIRCEVSERWVILIRIMNLNDIIFIFSLTWYTLLCWLVGRSVDLFFCLLLLCSNGSLFRLFMEF